MTMGDVAPPWGVALTDGEHALVQFGVTVAAFGLAAMLTRLVSARREVGDRFRPAVHAGIAVCTVALLSYVLLIIELHLGYRRVGGVWVPNAESVGTWSARYMDWVVSVPLLVVEIIAVSALIGAAAARARAIGVTAAVGMVLLGYLGAVVLQGGTDFTLLLALGIASSVCFAVVYAVVIVVVLRSLPVLPAAARVPLRRAMVVLVVTWFVYPVVYGMQGVVSGGAWTTTEHLLLCAADLVAKLVFGLLVLRVARIRTAADVLAGDDVHPESIWIDQLRQSEGGAGGGGEDVEPPMTDAQGERAPASVALPDRYRVEHVIGRGGTAVVYAAHDTLLNRPVAVKVFTAPTDTARVLREQQQEAQTLAGLTHHALVTLFDAGVDESDPIGPRIFLVMERIDGPDLGQRLRSGALNPVQVAYLGFDLCDALLYVHERGWLHRDIKPANVLLSARHLDLRLRGKLSDFGIAMMLGGDGDDGEFTVGTAAYLSPEQVDGGMLTGASDVYSLGLVLIQAVAGRVAFPGTVIESAFARLTADPMIPETVPPRLAGVLRAMTARAAGDRIGLEQARSEFELVLAEEIAAAANRPVEAPAPPPAPAGIVLADAPPDKEFARITAVAARLLRTPAAFAVLGAPEAGSFACIPDVHRVELAALALQTLAVDRTDGWAVEDVHSDPRTADAIRTAPVRSMAVQPIMTDAGERVGALAVLDALPRSFGAEEAATLSDLAHLVAHEYELRQAVRRALFSR